MSALIGEATRVMVQGITGKQGRRITREMMDYGTQVICGVTPGKSGEEVEGLPVYTSVGEALRQHPEVNTTLICVPPDHAKDAAIEAITAGPVSLLNILTEGVPVRDAAAIVECAESRKVRVVGPASIGIIAPPERVKIGAIGGNDPGVFYPGVIALFSKSGGMCLSLAMEIFNKLGYGVRIVVGMGGDRIVGTTFRDFLELVRNDPQTRLVVLNGEVGGNYEEEAAAYIRETGYPKRVVVRLAGVGAESIFPRGSRMGHAGAVIGDSEVGTFDSKVAAFESAGVPVAKNSEEFTAFVAKEMPTTGYDFDKPVTAEVELVSISKTKLESLKEQVRAVQIKTTMTELVEGVPYFRGYPLSVLIERATPAEMVHMALLKTDPTACDLARLNSCVHAAWAHSHLPREALRTACASVTEGTLLNVACSDGLLALPEKRAPRSLMDHFSAPVAECLVLLTRVISVVAAIFDHKILPRKAEPLEIKMFRALAGRVPTRAEADLIRALFVACVDHTPATPSSLAALTSYSGGNSLKTALAAGIGAMGDVHAGAGEGTARFLAEFVRKFRQGDAIDGRLLGSLAELAQYVVHNFAGKFGDEKRKIPGYGHRYYSNWGTDPRAEALLAVARRNGFAGDFVELATRIETILKESKSPGLCLNVDGVIGALLCELELDPRAGKASFIVPRTVGILGELLEQKAGSFFRLANESIIYMGPRVGRVYAPTSQVSGGTSRQSSFASNTGQQSLAEPGQAGRAPWPSLGRRA